MARERVKCLIVGSGPAGYTAAIYASRANLNPVLYEGIQPGGQLTTTTDIENFPGYPQGVSGVVMMDDLKNQALRFGTDVRFGIVTNADLSSRPFVLEIDGDKSIEADSLIIATGATAKYLGLESEEKFKGQGVSACATCDGFFYRKKDVAVVGGGDTACEEAIYLSGICNKVYLIVRRDVLRASKAMQERVLNSKNIEILWNTNTKEILGDEMGVTGAALVNNKSGEERVINIHGFFLAIGHNPNSALFKEYVNVDEQGYIITDGKSQQTNVPGVFAAGDVQDPTYRQAIAAAGSGCKAAMDAERFLQSLKIFILAFVSLFMFSCTTYYDSLLKSDNVDEKYNAAKSYLESGKYKKAADLFDNLLLAVQGTEQEDSVNFYHGLSNFKYGYYEIAEIILAKFIDVYPRSPFFEEASFLRIKCLYEATYRYELDQTPTHKAMQVIREYMLENPDSQYYPLCQEMLSEFMERLERKSFESAKLYYTMEDYKAAHYALKSVLKDNAENRYREQILYYTVMSSYKYAFNSISNKQKERYLDFIDDYYNFISEYPESKYRKELDGLYKRVEHYAIKSADEGNGDSNV